MEDQKEANEQLQTEFEQTIRNYMEKYKISKGVAWVMKDGNILVHSGFGTSPDAIFRIASITKYFTRVGVMQLIAEGKIELNTKVFPLLNLEPIPGYEWPVCRNISAGYSEKRWVKCSGLV